MKIVSFLIFMLAYDLFIKSNKAVTANEVKDSHCKPMQPGYENMKSDVVHCKPDNTVKTRCVPKPSYDCASGEPKKSQNTNNLTCHWGDDNPEECFNRNNENELEDDSKANSEYLKKCSLPHMGRNKEMSITEDCAKCTLQRENDGIILKCTPVSTISRCIQRSKKRRALMLYVKFLQISTAEDSKEPTIKSLMGKVEYTSTKKKSKG